jgi:hypothetical protein
MSDEALLRDLFNHQTWADAEHWRAIGAHPAARADQTIRKRLHHLHFVQHAFLWTVGDRKDPPLTITVAEALTQCAMHSHYHRGQNATRLRDLGGEPPPTDLIYWQWKGRPAGAW